MYRKFLKRLFDFAGAVILIIILFPVMIIVAVICMIAFRGKVLFIQGRIGKNEKPFRIIKFISMLPETPGMQTTDTQRITSTGKFLRKSSLDEIPQLFNILTGDMSFVGPRPLLIQYLPYYRPAERIRHSVRPGITGLAQIGGRNFVHWDERLQLDQKYVAEISFGHDLKILFKTLILLFNPRTIQTDPRSVMQDLDIERQHEQL